MSFSGKGAASGAASGAMAGTMIMPGWGTLIGGALGAVGGGLGVFGGSDIFGKKPSYPQAPSPSSILSENLMANLNTLPRAQEYAGRTNQFNLDQLNALYAQKAPGLDAARARQLANISSGLEGELSDATLDSLQRSGAAWGLTSGVGQGPMSGARTLRDLGRATEDRQRLAGQELESFINSTRRDILPPFFDSSSFAVRPQYDPYAQDERLVDIARIKAAPDPAAAGSAANQMALIEALLNVWTARNKQGSTSPGTRFPDEAGSGEGSSFSPFQLGIV